MLRGQLYRAFVLGLLQGLWACSHATETSGTPSVPALENAEVARLLPPKVKNREDWADDVVTAIRLGGKDPTAERVCAVLAVIEQESGFQPDPAVANLPAIVHQGLQEKLARLGPLAPAALDALLDGTAPGASLSFRERIAKLKTERDLDRFFRDIASAYRKEAPGSFAVATALSLLLGQGSLEDLNPVTTAGSMQVKVDFARAMSEGQSDEGVRELLYTRAGGVRFGTARLIGYRASYDDVVYRFADYNGGIYTSRNAAFQMLVAELTHTELVPDGDLLAWDRQGTLKDVETNTLHALLTFGESEGLSSWTIRSDAKQEKTAAFEDTKTWRAVRAAWEARTGKPAPYARIPDVALSSPKLARPRTTAWFAASVKKHYESCRARVAQVDASK